MTDTLAQAQEKAVKVNREYVNELEEINISLRVQLDEAIKRVNELETNILLAQDE